MKKFFTGLLLIIVVAAVGGFAFFSIGKQVDVEWDEEDYISALDKSAIKVVDVEEINLVTLAKGDFTTSGTNQIESSFTNAEISALMIQPMQTVVLLLISKSLLLATMKAR